jgi:hypothetical protein
MKLRTGIAQLSPPRVHALELNQVERSIHEKRSVKLPRNDLHIGLFHDELTGVPPMIA